MNEPSTAGASAACAPAPTAPAERIAAIDVVRGLAILGILVMNVVEFALPIAAYENPAAAGGNTGMDRATWFVQFSLFDGRMRALFSLLFGAGLVLVDQRMRAAGRGGDAADLLLRRCLWLTLFGIVHRFGLQFTGDILYQYGLLGLIAIAFRRAAPRRQITAGLMCLFAFVPIEGWHYWQARQLRSQAIAAEQLAGEGREVPRELQDARRRWDQRSEAQKPDAHAAEIAAMRGGYTTVFGYRWNYHHSFQSAYLYYYWVWDVLGMMLIGMGLMQLGFFHGRVPSRVYVVALAAGAAATIATFALAWKTDANGHLSSDIELAAMKRAAYPFVRGVAALAWAALLILAVRHGVAAWLTRPLAAVGRMALSCYVLQTVLCTLLFFGYGLGCYASFSRSQLMLVWLAASAAQIAFAVLWLRTFRFGPLEWAWRSLTWWRRQPLRRRDRTEPLATG